MTTQHFHVNIFAIGPKVFLLWFFLVPVSCTFCQVVQFTDDMIHTMWDPIWWTPGGAAEACTWYHASYPDSGFSDFISLGLDKVAWYGYPYHYTLVSGVNDTVGALVHFDYLPVPGKAYDFSGKSVEQWFAPQAYPMYVPDSGGPALRDSTQLGHRMRGWWDGVRLVQPPSVFSGEDYARYTLKLDIWNLPTGRFQLCVLPTDKVPKELQAYPSGDVYEFYPPKDLADSCNGYEGCYWRSTYDGNFSAAKNWVGKILSINPKSVPGWWLKADNALDVQDIASAKAAYDSAIVYLNSRADPAMPDSTTRPLLKYEKLYIEWLQTILPYNRAQLGP